MLGHRRLVVVLCCLVAINRFPVPYRVDAAEPTPAAIQAWVKALKDDGQLSVEFYDPNKPPKPYPGWTDFQFRLSYRYDYQIEFPKKKKGPRLTAFIVPKYTKMDVTFSNRVLLPKGLESEQWYQAPLAKHELEHVRIGLHPRLEMLCKHLIQKVNRVEIQVDAMKDITAELVAEQVSTTINLRKDAIESLVGSINREVDAVTNHGGIPMPNFDEFLAGLYSKEHLDEMKFPFLAEVLDLLATPEYQKARFVIPDVKPDTTKK